MIGATHQIMVACVLLGALSSGCTGDHSFSYLGTWEGDRHLNPIPGTDPHVVDQAARLILTIHDDGTFTLIDAGMDKTGNFDVEDGHGVLRITSIHGQPMERQSPDVQKMNVPITLVPLVRTQTLKYFDPTGFDKNGLILKLRGK